MKPEIQAYVEKADLWINAHKAEFIEEIQGLARIPSVSHPEEAAEKAPFGAGCRRVLDHALARGQAYGFDTEGVQVRAPHPERAAGEKVGHEKASLLIG